MSDIKDFLALPSEVQRNFQVLFRATLEKMTYLPSKDCYQYSVTGELMTVDQYKTLKMLSEV